MKTVIFVGAHDLLVPYINELSNTHNVVVYENGVFSVPVSSKVTVRQLKKRLFGIQYFFTGERSLPWYMSNLRKSLAFDKPDDIVVLDFIRLWYFQVLWYCLWHKKTQLHVYSETQRTPSSLFSATAFVLFRFLLRVFQYRLATYFSFTQLGSDYAHRIGIRVKTILLPPPIDTNLFKPKGHNNYSSNTVLRVLVNARYVSYKRHNDVFEAVSILVRQGVKISLTCVGRGSQEDLQKIRNQSEKFGLQGVVTFIAPMKRSEMPGLYQSFDILVLASDNEAVGMVVPEAMACGIPTITSDTVGANLYVLPNKTGLIFKTKNVHQLVKSIEFFLDKHFLDKASALARLQIELNFTPEKLISRIRERLS